MRGAVQIVIVAAVVISWCPSTKTTSTWRRKVIDFGVEESETASTREARANYRDGGSVVMGMDVGNAVMPQVASGGDKVGASVDGTDKKAKKSTDLMSKILPMMVMPFLVSSSLIPMVLTSLKIMLLKSVFVGKIAIFLIALNFLWRSENRGGVYSHNVNIEHDGPQKDVNQGHYGYNGDDEYGAYVHNRRSGGYR